MYSVSAGSACSSRQASSTTPLCPLAHTSLTCAAVLCTQKQRRQGCSSSSRSKLAQGGCRRGQPAAHVPRLASGRRSHPRLGTEPITVLANHGARVPDKSSRWRPQTESKTAMERRPHLCPASLRVRQSALPEPCYVGITGRSAPALAEPAAVPKKVPPGAVSRCAAATNLPTSGSDSTCAAHSSRNAPRFTSSSCLSTRSPRRSA